MNIEALREALETYPQLLYRALEAIEKAEREIEELRERIEAEEALLVAENTDATESESGAEAREIERLRLDHELALLELEYERLRGTVELGYRRNPPKGEKITEATVAAYIKSHEQVVEAKKRCLEKKYERDTLPSAWRMQAAARRAENQPDVTSPKLERLRIQLVAAEGRLADARRSLEQVKVSLTTYQMLVQLYTAGLIR
jgi:chromosome segregation ATPase